MAKALETGLPKMRIEEAAARRQAHIDSGKETIVGVNKYRLAKEDKLDIFSIDNTAVRESQVQRLQKLRANRDEAAGESLLNAITEAAESGSGNLLELAVEAARARASWAKFPTRWRRCLVATRRSSAPFPACTAASSARAMEIETVRKWPTSLSSCEGRRPRIMVAKIGQDGHDRGAKVVATAFADLGFDVDIGALFQTPEEVARQAVENDVHVVGMSSLAAGHKTLLPQLVGGIEEAGREDIMVVIGGVIPAQDYEYLKANGAAAIFGPGTVIPVAAQKVIAELNERLAA
jgi:methylmalonyl-CoA mutase